MHAKHLSVILALGLALPALAQVTPTPVPTVAPTPIPTVAPTPVPTPVIHPDRVRMFNADEPLEHTSAKNQGGVGFCWSYSAAGLIEGEYKKMTGRNIDLSEEYVGFYYLYDQVMANASKYFDAERRSANTNVHGIKRWFSKIGAKTKNLINNLTVNLLFGVSEGAPSMHLAMDTMKKYGAVPESVFSYKITGQTNEQGVKDRVMNFVNNTLRDPVLNKEYRVQNADGTYSNQPIPEKIRAALAKAFTLEDNATPAHCNSCDLINASSSFTIDGHRYTPQNFLSDYIQFDPTRYHQIDVKAANFDDTIQRIERSLDAGEAVQIGVILMTGFREAAKGKGIWVPENCGKYTECKPEGGHAILIVNKTVDPTTHQLNGFIIKNSWGFIGLDDRGTKQGELGYHIITPDYLKEASSVYQGAGKPRKELPWYVLLNNAY